MNTKEFTQAGTTIVFYKKGNDEKFSFIIKDNPNLTERLLNSVKTKRVKEKDLKYAVKGIFEKITEILNDNFDLYEENINKLKINNMEKNPIVELSERVQKEFGASIETKIIGKKGADHNPTITVEIELPNGNKYQASGSNQKIAKQRAAEKALEEL